MTDDEPVYTNERVIGHHVRAEVAEPSEYTRWLNNVADELGMERLTSDRVEIVEGDVDWDEPRKVRLTRQEIQELAERFPP